VTRPGRYREPAVEKGIGVSITNLGHVYPGGTVALRDVSFEVGAGEFVTLVGPSGCGKSTILRLMTGLSSPTSGQICGPGGSSLKDTSIVFQHATLLPWRKVLSNVELPLELKMGSQMSKLERRAIARNCLQLVGLADSADRLPRQLSGGMQMRVSIARALAVRPPLLLLDEPFGALDDMTRQSLQLELLRIWRDQGCTIVFVTHNVTEAVLLSDRVVVMKSDPGAIAKICDIPIPRPRSDETRDTPEFVALVAEVRAALQQDQYA